MRGRPELEGKASLAATFGDLCRNGSMDEYSDAGSIHTTTPLSEPSSVTYATHRDLVNSSDTLRLFHSSDSSASPGTEKEVFIDSSESPTKESPPTDRSRSPAVLEDHKVAEGVATAGKGVSQTMDTMRILVASTALPGQAWEIMQGKHDEAVEEKVIAIGLEGADNHGKTKKGAEISRTPSQSTTGTFESSTTDSIETAASSLQSNPSSEVAPHDKDAESKSALDSSSPAKLYSNTCSSCDDLSQQKRNSTALRRYHALLELVETERSYAEDLGILVNIFFENLSTQAFFDESEPRIKAVCRNAKELLALHNVLAQNLGQVVEENSLSAEAEGSDLSKALRCEGAIVELAQRLTKAAPQFDLYQLFCSRHTEALVLIREAEKRHGGDDFAAYERMCSNLIRGQMRSNRGERWDDLLLVRALLWH
jgi:hypothetical protein